MENGIIQLSLENETTKMLKLFWDRTLAEILASVGFNQKQINTALGSIIGRLIHPGSELRACPKIT